MDHIDPVVTDGLTVRGAYALDGHPTIAYFEREFLAQQAVYPEIQDVVHYRWQMILTRIPEMRGRHLYEDLRDVYDAIERGPPTPAVGAAWDLTWLQEHFWEALFQHQLTLLHVKLWHCCTAQAWRRRMMHRIQDQRGWRRDGGKLKGPRSAAIRKTQKWYN